MRSLRSLLISLSAIFLAFFAVPLVQAQTTNATVNGLVLDSSGAVVPGAAVQAINDGTNLVYPATTNNEGVYSLPSLPPGRYHIQVSKAGFKTLIKPDIILNVQDARAVNFTLQVGAASETVTVEGGVPLINTESAAVSTVVDRQFVENMPLNGRSFQTLIALTPGVVLTKATGTEPGQFSINGQRADANYFTVDGASANIGINFLGGLGQSAAGALPAFSALGGTNTLVSVDAMQEFRIQTSSFAPEFGRTPGGQISIVTRSGTNQFHGTLFDYFRNDVLDANNWFNGFCTPGPNCPLPKAKDRQNDFGGVLGGPIIKDKTFFFFSYEGLRLRQPKTAVTTVPSARVRQAAPSQIQPFLNAFPVPNGPEFVDTSGNPTGLSPFSSSYSDPSTLDAYSIRLDHTISSKLTLFGRYNYAPSEAVSRNTAGLESTNFLSVDTHTLTVGLTASFSSNINNEARMNYSNVRGRSLNQLDAFGGAVPPPDSVLFPQGFSSKNGRFFLGDGFLGGSPLLDAGSKGIAEQRQVNIVDNLSVTRGAHGLRLGVDFRWLFPFASPQVYQQQAFFAGGNSVLSGLAASVQITANGGNALLDRNFSLYGQDSWRIARRLTLTYGLRWDVNLPLKGKDASNDPFTVQGLDNPATMTLAPRGTQLYRTTYGNVAPRVGVAHQLRQRQSWETVLRGGFGVFYDLGAGSLGNVTSGFPYAANKNLSSVPFPLMPQQAAPPSLSLNPPVSVLRITEPSLKLPRTYQWNVALEQALGSRQTFSATYVGAAGRDLLRRYNLSNPNANFGLVSVTANTGTSNYQALQLQFRRRVSHGLQALASYTWSHSIDNASTDSGGFAAPNVINANVDRGNSDFDVRHTFTGAVTYNIPSSRQGKTVRAILGDWSLDSLLIARSAPPVDLTGRTSVIAGTLLTARPNLMPGPPLYLFGPQFPGGKEINPAAFIAAASGQQGNFGRNVLRGFGAWQVDFTLRRQFHLTERLGLQFRAEFFNVFNHPNFGNPGATSVGQPLFGQSTQTLAQSLGSGGLNGGFNPLYQVGGPRSVQLALKLQF